LPMGPVDSVLGPGLGVDVFALALQHFPKSRFPPVVGRTVGHHRLLEKVGGGGIDMVYITSRGYEALIPRYLR